MFSGNPRCPTHPPPPQVASHAQKYFIRLNSQNKKDKRRASIHDITTVAPPVADPSAGPAAFMSQVPITGQNPAVAAVVAPGAPPPAVAGMAAVMQHAMLPIPRPPQ